MTRLFRMAFGFVLGVLFSLAGLRLIAIGERWLGIGVVVAGVAGWIVVAELRRQLEDRG